MTRYVTLIRFIRQGVRAIKKSLARAEAFHKACRRAGVNVETQLWTAGAYDGVMILSAKNEAKVLAAIAKLASLGYVHTETLQAFDAREFAAIVGG